MRSHSFKRATSTLHNIAMELVTWPTVLNVREMNQNWMQPPSLSLLVIKQLIWMWKPTDRCWELQESCRDSWKKYELSSRQIELHLSKKYSGGSPGTNSSQSCRIWKELSGNRRLKRQFGTIAPYFVSGGILVGWVHFTLKSVGSIPPVTVPNPDQPPLAIY